MPPLPAKYKSKIKPVLDNPTTICIACGGSGKASKGGRCVPCCGKGILTKRDSK